MTRVAAADLTTRTRVRAVDLTGIAPVSPPCEDSILLLKYRPVAPPKGIEPSSTLIDNQPTSPDISKGMRNGLALASATRAPGSTSALPGRHCVLAALASRRTAIVIPGKGSVRCRRLRRSNWNRSKCLPSVNRPGPITEQLESPCATHRASNDDPGVKWHISPDEIAALASDDDVRTHVPKRVIDPIERLSNGRLAAVTARLPDHLRNKLQIEIIRPLPPTIGSSRIQQDHLSDRLPPSMFALKSDDLPVPTIPITSPLIEFFAIHPFSF